MERFLAQRTPNYNNALIHNLQVVTSSSASSPATSGDEQPWCVDVDNLDSMWLSPRDRRQMMQNTKVVRLTLSPKGILGLGVASKSCKRKSRRRKSPRRKCNYRSSHCSKDVNLAELTIRNFQIDKNANLAELVNQGDLNEGDVIRMVNGHFVDSVDTFKELLSKACADIKSRRNNSHNSEPVKAYVELGIEPTVKDLTPLSSNTKELCDSQSKKSYNSEQKPFPEIKQNESSHDSESTLNKPSNKSEPRAVSRIQKEQLINHKKILPQTIVSTNFSFSPLGKTKKKPRRRRSDETDSIHRHNSRSEVTKGHSRHMSLPTAPDYVLQSYTSKKKNANKSRPKSPLYGLGTTLEAEIDNLFESKMTHTHKHTVKQHKRRESVDMSSCDADDESIGN